MIAPFRSRHNIGPRRLSAVVVLVVGSILAGCIPTGERPELVDETIPALIDLVEPAVEPCPEPSGQFQGFSSAVVRVVRLGEAVQRCVLVADTGELRARGLMEVSDLAGYDAMVFAFAADSTNGFWMRNTVVALSIAFVDADGQVVSTADMDPCPDQQDCPLHAPDGPYRWAVEVLQGQLGDFGLNDGGSLDPAHLPLATQ